MAPDLLQRLMTTVRLPKVPASAPPWQQLHANHPVIGKMKCHETSLIFGERSCRSLSACWQPLAQQSGRQPLQICSTWCQTWFHHSLFSSSGGVGDRARGSPQDFARLRVSMTQYSNGELGLCLSPAAFPGCFAAIPHRTEAHVGPGSDTDVRARAHTRRKQTVVALFVDQLSEEV